MSENKQIIDQVKPNLANKPTVNFVHSDFEALIENKGYDVWHDRAIKCPCSSKNGGDALSTCRNCGGSGWFYVNRTKTRMVIQAMNVDTDLKEWSEERLGLAKISARSVDRLTFMDRITLIDSRTEHSQVLFLKKQPDTNQLYGSLRYDPLSVYSVFLFVSDTSMPRRLMEGEDFEIDGNQIKTKGITYNSIDNPTISVRYTHRADFTVLDMMRDVMVSQNNDECTREEEDLQYPIHAIGRRTHYVIDRTDYFGDNLFDNSFDSNYYNNKYSNQYR